MQPQDRCDWCEGRGLVPVYHREYRGEPVLLIEHTDAFGEIKTRRTAGAIAVHCNCPLGTWTRERTEPDVRSRIPTLSDVLSNRIPYQIDRADLEDESALTQEAVAFTRRWKGGFGGKLQGVPRLAVHEPRDVEQALRERSRRLDAAGGAA